LNEEQQVLVTLRKIIRAMDIYSRHLRKTVGLTVPQLLLLQTIRDLGAVSISTLSSEVSLSPATVTSIIDRLVARELIRRERSALDKRIVHAVLTEVGETVLDTGPTPLQEEFSEKFAELRDWEKSMIITALQRVAVLMNAEEIDASPVLHIDAEIERSTH
jgi:DNA-binding MarR family transcriptional regulator